MKDGIPHLVQDSSMLYGKVGYHEWEGLSINKDERVRISENMGDNKVLIMKNHGLLTVGATAGEASPAVAPTVKRPWFFIIKTLLSPMFSEILTLSSLLIDSPSHSW